MKDATLSPLYMTMYPGLCDTARKHGYALAVHGTTARDFDLVAIPWTDEAIDPKQLVDALIRHTGACLYPELMRRYGATEEQVEQIIKDRSLRDPMDKPHGRLAWSLHLANGAYIDLSVMPRSVRADAQKGQS